MAATAATASIELIRKERHHGVPCSNQQAAFFLFQSWHPFANLGHHFCHGGI
jgi:hypothetical protein